MRVKVVTTGLYTYPDLSIVCGPPQFTDDAQDTLLNPLVIIEVLSPSAERYDRGMKFQQYRTIETLLDFVLIAQDEQRIEHFARQVGNQWLLEEITKPEGICALSAVTATITLEDVYEKSSPSTTTFLAIQIPSSRYTHVANCVCSPTTFPAT